MNRKDLEFFGLKSDSREDLLPKVTFFVEGSSDSMRRLKEKYDNKDWHNGEAPLPWENYGFGNGIEVGQVKSGGVNHSVVVNFNYCRIGDSLIAFYECNSRCCDWTMIEEYLTHNYPIKYDDTRSAMTTEGNFHNCYHYCQEMYNSPYEEEVLFNIKQLHPDLDIEIKRGQLYISDSNLLGWREKWIRDIDIDRDSNEMMIDVITKISNKITTEYISKLERFKKFKEKVENSKLLEEDKELLEFALDIEASKGKEVSHAFINGFEKCLNYLENI